MNGEKIFVLDSSKAELKRPKGEVVVTTTEHEGQNIGVGLIDRRKISTETGKRVGKTIIWPMSYLARLDDFEKQRLATIAEELNARVIGVELPGVGMSDKSNMTFMQKLNLFRGNFDRSASAMLGAIKEVVGEDWGDSVDFVCYSQGAVLGASMVKQLSEHAYGLNVSVGKNIIIEDGNDTKLNYRLTKIGGEDTSPEAEANKIKSDITDRYLNQNKKWSWFVGPADRADGLQAKKRIVDLRVVKPGVNNANKSHFDIIPIERRTDGGKEKREELDKKQKIVLALGAFGLLFSSIRKNLSITKENGNLGDVNILKFNGSKITSFENNKETADYINRIKKAGNVTTTLVVAPIDKENPKNNLLHHPTVHSMADLIELLK